jgi:argininosuccinate lyase
MELSAKKGFTNATDAADYLVKKGMPFRDAHSVIGRLVLACIEKGKSIDEMDLSELKEICPEFDEDIYEAVSLETCVERRLTAGAPGRQEMEKVINIYRGYLARDII